MFTCPCKRFFFLLSNLMSCTDRLDWPAWTCITYQKQWAAVCEMKLSSIFVLTATQITQLYSTLQQPSLLISYLPHAAHLMTLWESKKCGGKLLPAVDVMVMEQYWLAPDLIFVIFFFSFTKGNFKIDVNQDFWMEPWSSSSSRVPGPALVALPIFSGTMTSKPY